MKPLELHPIHGPKMNTDGEKSKIFVYNFNRDLPGRLAEKNFGAFHAGEIPDAYNNLETFNLPWTETDNKIANMMPDYWENFSKSGNPNATVFPLWVHSTLLMKK